MKPGLRQTGVSRVIRVMLALYLGLFVAWFAPHHTQAHCAGDIAATSSVRVAGQISAHHPELCQLCHAHGQVDLVLSSCVTISQPASASTFSPFQYQILSPLTVESLSPRSPPVFA